MSRWTQIRYLIKEGAELDILDQMQWYQVLKQLQVKHTVQSDGILINLKKIPDPILTQLHAAMVALVERHSFPPV
jgi:hypothetical protein